MSLEIGYRAGVCLQVFLEPSEQCGCREGLAGARHLNPGFSTAWGPTGALVGIPLSIHWLFNASAKEVHLTEAS